jgi:outer membrane lipoprotein-sorting protein
MSLSNLRKFFPVLGLLFLFIPACQIWQTLDNRPVSAVDDPQNVFPFSTKTPDVYQTEVVITTGPLTQKYFIAKDHDKWRIDYSTGEPNELTILQNGTEHYLSLPKKIYAENTAVQTGAIAADNANDTMSDLMYHKPYADFEKLSHENNITTYKAKLNDSTSSEVLVYVDEAIGLPVKQEFYGINGDKKTLEYSVEFRNFKLNAGDDLFKIPDGFKKVTMQEFQKKR